MNERWRSPQSRRPGRHRSPLDQPRLVDGAWADPYADDLGSAFGLELHHGRHDGTHHRSRAARSPEESRGPGPGAGE
ncbi:hypothetical protein ACRYCC_01880 [Actinomadura scrupuli]|uniref:hypothetical protein n=1 Tax=Actinomadura scrupuli TaxID=559629 RepID=UPI003D9886BC